MDARRRTRADGRASRDRILRATAEIAGERGYEGTSISLVSERSALPKSSIYWHFRDKDDLIAAVIDDSYERWRHSLAERDDEADDEIGLAHSMGMLAEFPDFIRLGLLLVLERQPVEPTARRRFVDIRGDVQRRFAHVLRRRHPDLSDDDVDWLRHHVMVLTDGYFLAMQAGELTLAECTAGVSEAFGSALEARLRSRR